MKAVIIRADDSRELVEFTRETEYETISGAVDGYIERIPLPSRGADMWVNEEGKLKHLPLNHGATRLWEENYGCTDYTAGDAIVTGAADGEGYMTGLSDTQIEQLMPAAPAVELPEDEYIHPDLEPLWNDVLQAVQRVLQESAKLEPEEFIVPEWFASMCEVILSKKEEG